MSIKAAFINILEDGTVTVTSAETDYPAYRLYDRYMGRVCKSTSTATQTIHVDQGTSPVPVDLLVIPAGHNLGTIGADVSWQYSANNSTWFDAVAAWTQADDLQIVKQAAAPLTKRYWRVVISSMSAAYQIGEIFISLLNSFSAGCQPSTSGSRFGMQGNVQRNESRSGIPQALILGEDRKLREYDIPQASAADLAILQAWDSAWSGGKPFFFEDHAGAQFFAELIERIMPNSFETLYKAQLRILEYLG